MNIKDHILNINYNHLDEKILKLNINEVLCELEEVYSTSCFLIKRINRNNYEIKIAKKSWIYEFNCIFNKGHLRKYNVLCRSFAIDEEVLNNGVEYDEKKYLDKEWVNDGSITLQTIIDLEKYKLLILRVTRFVDEVYRTQVVSSESNFLKYMTALDFVQEKSDSGSHYKKKEKDELSSITIYCIFEIKKMINSIKLQQEMLSNSMADLKTFHYTKSTIRAISRRNIESIFGIAYLCSIYNKKGLYLQIRMFKSFYYILKYVSHLDINLVSLANSEIKELLMNSDINQIDKKDYWILIDYIKCTNNNEKMKKKKAIIKLRNKYEYILFNNAKSRKEFLETCCLSIENAEVGKNLLSRFDSENHFNLNFINEFESVYFDNEYIGKLVKIHRSYIEFMLTNILKSLNRILELSVMYNLSCDLNTEFESITKSSAFFLTQ